MMGSWKHGLQLGALLALGLAPALRAELPEKQVAAARERWSEDIAKLLAKDREETHPANAVLFLGSSSIRLWETIERDMAPYHPIQRGYGGARFSDLVVFADELAAAHRYRAVVIYVGNDVTGKEEDPEPAQVAEWFRQVAADARKHQPEAEVFCLAVTPTPKRHAAWAKIQEVNAALQQACEADPKLHFVATAGAYLDAGGEPHADYFKTDKLHQNEAGYHVWSGLIKAALHPVIGE